MTDPLRRALQLARRGRYRTAPNPMVGAVLVRGETVVGEGWHRQLGGPHAEVEALAQAGERARGATLYLNLEPCSHHGRTPPCVEALIGAGIRRVVACHGDPDRRVAGRGFSRLRAAGIEVVVGELQHEAMELNQPFLTRQLLDRPAVTLKWAMSLDGRIATAWRQSRWISSPAGRRWALDLRESHDAILVGSGTVLADDPSLNRRLGKARGPILRVVLDRRLRFPLTARMLEIDGPVRIFTQQRDPVRRSALRDRGAEVVVVERLDPAAVLADLQQLGIQSLLVEGGSEVHAAFVGAGLFDRVEICCAAILLGGAEAPGPVGAGVRSPAEAPRLDGLRVFRRGPDRILSGRREGAIAELARRLREGHPRCR